jgi:hypothetical protein
MVPGGVQVHFQGLQLAAAGVPCKSLPMSSSKSDASPCSSITGSCELVKTQGVQLKQSAAS